MTARAALPNKRPSEHVRMMRGTGWRRKEYTVSISRYADGRIGEIFLDCTHAEAGEQAMAADWCVTASIALQHGVPLEMLQHCVHRGEQGEPATMIGEILDLICGLPE